MSNKQRRSPIVTVCSTITFEKPIYLTNSKELSKPEISLKINIFDEDGYKIPCQAMVYSQKTAKNTRRYFLKSITKGINLNGERIIIGRTNIVTTQIVRHLQNKAIRTGDPVMKAFLLGQFGE